MLPDPGNTHLAMPSMAEEKGHGAEMRCLCEWQEMRSYPTSAIEETPLGRDGTRGFCAVHVTLPPGAGRRRRH